MTFWITLMVTSIMLVRVTKLPNPTGLLKLSSWIGGGSTSPVVPFSTETVLLNRFTTKTLAPSDVIATPWGPMPTGTGSRASRKVSVSITDTVPAPPAALLPELVTNTRFPSGMTATPKGTAPTFAEATTGFSVVDPISAVLMTHSLPYRASAA